MIIKSKKMAKQNEQHEEIRYEYNIYIYNMHVIMDVYDIKDIQDGSQWISMVLYDHALHDGS